MKKFRFSLETVLKVRRQAEEARQRELAEAQAQRDRALMQLGADERALRGLLAEQSAGRTGKLDLAAEAWYQARQISLLNAISHGKADLLAKEEALDLARAKAVEAARERRVLEKLEEQQLAEHLEKLNREEQGLLDDLAQRAVSALSLPPASAA